MRFPWKICRYDVVESYNERHERYKNRIEELEGLRDMAFEEMRKTVSLQNEEIHNLKQEIALMIDRNAQTLQEHQMVVVKHRKTLVFVKSLRDLLREVK